MSEFEDYQLEEAEDAAVKNSQMAKRAGIALGGAAVVGGVAYAATSATDSTEDMEAEDILNGTESGELTDDVISQPHAAPQPAPQPAAEAPEVPEEPEVQKPEVPQTPESTVEFTSSEYYYDENGNLIGSIDKGTVEGREFTMIDQDADGKADILAIDENGDGIYQEHEIHDVTNEGLNMGNSENKSQIIVTEEEGNGEDDTNGEDINDVPNDYDDKNTEEYQNDIAKDNPDYKNDAFEEIEDEPQEEEIEVSPIDEVEEIEEIEEVEEIEDVEEPTVNRAPEAPVEEPEEEILDPIEEPVVEEEVVEEEGYGDISETDDLVSEETLDEAEPYEEEYGYEDVSGDDMAYTDDASESFDDVDLV